MRLRILAGASLVLALHLSSPARAGVNSWTPTGPEGGFVNAVRHDPANPQRLFALVGMRLYRSVDAGATWTAGGTIANGVDGLTDLAVDPANANTLYVAADRSGFFRSTDGGNTFTLIRADFFRHARYVATSSDGAVVYLVYLDGGLFVSTDRGGQWTERAGNLPTGTLPGGTLNHVTAISLAPGNVLYAALMTNGVYRSIDGGISWTSRNAGLSASVWDVVAADSSDPDRVLAGANDGLYVSDNGGTTWSRQSFVNQSVQEIVVDVANSNRLLARTLFEVHLSNAGAAGPWQPITTSLSAAPPQSVTWHPAVPDRIHVGASDGIYVTSNAGTDWSPSHAGIAQTQAAVMQAAEDGSDALFIGTPYGGAYTTSANAQRWSSMSLAGLRAAAGAPRGAHVSALGIHAPDSKVMYAGLLNAGLVYTGDGGANWERRAAADDRMRSIVSLAVDPTDPRVVYAASSNDGVLKSVDGGQTWAAANDEFSGCQASANATPAARSIVIDRTNPAILYFTGRCDNGTGFGVYRSTNGAESWEPRNTGIATLSGNAVTVDPANGDVLYFSPSHEALFVSTDAGATWQPAAGIRSSNAAFQVAIDPVHPATIYLAAFSVARSVDRGASWEILRDHAQSPIWNAQTIAIDPQRPHIVYAGDLSSGVHVFEVATDLVLTIEGHSGERTVGTLSQLVISARNAGPWAANAVRVGATLGNGFPSATVSADRGACAINGAAISCEPLILRAGQSQRITVRYTPGAAGTLALEASVDGYEPDPNADNDSAQASVNVIAPPPIAAPPPSQGGGGGGGSLDATALVLLLARLLLAGGARSRRRLALAHFGR